MSMTIDRVYTPGLAQVAYVVADKAAHVAAVIDPRRDIAAYLDWAERHEVRIVAILETHVHADFVSGARELAAATGAPIFASRLGESQFPHQPLNDRAEIPIGQLRLRALWTPGHTPEHLAYLLLDPAQGPEPRAIFSGDALFVGEVGRPDLLGKEQTERLAGQLYHTVVDRLSRLPDDLIVYPGHTAGSACGKKIGDAPRTTIGQERLTNYAFQARSHESFVRMVLDGMPTPPSYYPVLKRVNTFGPPLLASLPPGEALTADRVAAAIAAGALVIDARSPAAFGAGHLPGALSVGLGANFTAWLGWIAPYDRDLILVLDDEARLDEARTELHRIGLDRFAGFLAGGVDAWRASGRATIELPQISVQTLAQRLAAEPNGLLPLDVRSDAEWADGHVAEAVHRFAGEIAQGAEPPLDGASEVAVVCGTGFRSSVAASVLQARGRTNLVNVAGGMTAWLEAGLPITTP